MTHETPCQYISGIKPPFRRVKGLAISPGAASHATPLRNDKFQDAAKQQALAMSRDRIRNDGERSIGKVHTWIIKETTGHAGSMP
jgi:hypothetical protein